MKMLDTPTQVFNSSTPTYQEITKIVRKMKSSASACPLDQISILTLQNCPYLRTVVPTSYHKLLLGQSDSTESMEVWIHNLNPQKGLCKRTSKFSTDNTRTGALKNTVISYSK